MSFSNSTVSKFTNVLSRNQFLLETLQTIVAFLAAVLLFFDAAALLGVSFKLSFLLVLAGGIFIFAVAAFMSWPRDITAEFAFKSKISVIEDDLIGIASKHYNSPHLIVVGTSCTFETDSRSVNRRSVQAQVTDQFSALVYPC